MSSQFGYDFYFKDGDNVLTFPITPAELSIKVGSRNETITLMNDGEINLLKSPSLTEIEFEARFPMRQYPYAREFKDFQTYWDTFQDLKEKRKSFRFIVSRRMDIPMRVTEERPNSAKPGATITRTIITKVPRWDTNILVSLESVEFNESYDEGDDVIVSFSLKQYKPFGVVKYEPQVKDQANSGAASVQNSREGDNNSSNSQSYTVKSGDCLWNIAKKHYGSGSSYTTIYNANKSAIEADAKKHGKASSSNGHWIWPGLKLTIPPK